MRYMWQQMTVVFKKYVKEYSDTGCFNCLSEHRTAAHRLQEVSESIFGRFLLLQLNGDEPLINTEAIAKAIPDYVPQDIEYGTNINTNAKLRHR